MVNTPVSVFAPKVAFVFSQVSIEASSFRHLSDVGNTSVSRIFAPGTYSSDSTHPIFHPAIYASNAREDVSSTVQPVLSSSSERVPNGMLVLAIGRPSLGNKEGLHPGRTVVAGRAVGVTPVTPGAAFL